MSRGIILREHRHFGLNRKFVVCVTHGKYLHRLKAGDLKAQNRSTVMKPRLKLAKLSGMKQSSDAATPSGNEEDAVCAMQACNENDVIMLVTKRSVNCAVCWLCLL